MQLQPDFEPNLCKFIMDSFLKLYNEIHNTFEGWMNRFLSDNFVAVSNAKRNSGSQTCALRLLVVFTTSSTFSSVYL